jgi:glycosidase
MSFELHVSRAAREQYELDGALFSLHGRLLLPDFQATRRLAQRMNEGRPADDAVQAGELNALGLIDEILHHVVALYREQIDPRAVTRALQAVEHRLGRGTVDATLLDFVDLFPPVAVYRGEIERSEYLSGASDQASNREIALEELSLLWLTNANPAAVRLRELFHDRQLEASAAYHPLIAALIAFWDREPPFGPEAQPLIHLLRAPAMAVPDSLSGQLRFIRERWGLLLGRLADRLALSLDVLEQEERDRWRRFHPVAPGEAADTASVPTYAGMDVDEERFSHDRDWMPRLLLMAKSTHVWLDQLSRQYERPIARLDQIPDEELDRLAAYGFTGLWLIGLWQRSQASQRIKQLRGNPEAVASAYSLDEYRIADDLGGEAAYADLRDRAARRGMRLASDMVPNHMGIDSRWVMEHPDWFIGLDHAPYPSYTFTGPDLSSRPGAGIFLEDHYYDGSDAAVVFKRTDASGERFIYHGNDGTAMPWNDTAQLDYLNPQVREAVIETILEVARRFPVIRFDAAMTLARRHVQRLWYPEPGSGATAIPSRNEYGAMSGAEFNRSMPAEFWREVVDRVAADAPDTLLLAEAFWMMEGYFVRTLGMHRVYNSAFMNMLRDEKNAEYRALIRQTLEFDPEILKRFVNFMNNPDERTAVDQFGKGDKYFGVCTVMVTLPGLPMFGHGQIEGYAEKYGMEYRRAYWEEHPDPWLVERHEREIVPLLHRRAAFAEVRDFLLFDFVTDGGGVDENVFVYSNRSGGERSLVVYHNSYASTTGRIHESAAYGVRRDGETQLVRRTLGDGLRLTDADDAFTVFRDARTGLEQLRSSRELLRDGLRLELNAYACHVFLDFREVADAAGLYRRLADQLAGSGVSSVEEALRELELEPVHQALRRLLDPAQLLALSSREPPLDHFEERLADLLRTATGATNGPDDGATAAAQRARRILGTALRRPVAGAERVERKPRQLAELLAWIVIDALPRPSLVDDFRLAPALAGCLRGLGLDEQVAWRAVEAGRLLVELPELPRRALRGRVAEGVWRDWISDPGVRRFIGVNRHDGVEWFSREALDDLLRWVAARSALVGTGEEAARAAKLTDRLRAAAADAGYRIDAMTRALAGSSAPRRQRASGARRR